MNHVPTGPVEWSKVAHLRQGLYRLLGVAFLPPTVARLHDLALGARVLDDMGLEAFPFSQHCVPLLRALQQTWDASALDVEHVRLFASAVEGTLCPLTESHYLSGEAAKETAQLKRDYRRLGLVPRAGIEPDSLAGQLEALSTLCGSEADAWAANERDAVRHAVRAERWFLERHLSRWVPHLARRLGDANALPPYGLLGDAVRALVVHDRVLLASLARELEAAEAAWPRCARRAQARATFP